MKKKIDFFFKF